MLTIQFISKIGTSWMWLWFYHQVFSSKSWKCIHISQNMMCRCTTGIAKFLFQSCTISHVHVTFVWLFLICQMWLRGQLVTLPLSQTMLLEWIWKDLKWLSFNFYASHFSIFTGIMLHKKATNASQITKRELLICTLLVINTCILVKKHPIST